MPRRKISSDESKLQKGRGQGHGGNYTPFLRTSEVPSHGKSTRVKGWKTGRVHHFLSTHESNYFYILEWSPAVVDIREQFPLPLDETTKIAERLAIKHPVKPKDKTLAVVTTDFLIDVAKEGVTTLKARTVKPSNDLNSLRTIEKLEIERTYWRERGVDWGIVTECEIPKPLAQNVEWIHTALDFDDAPGIDPAHISFIESSLFDFISATPTASLAAAGIEVDMSLGLRNGTCLWVVRHLIASKQWGVNMMLRIYPANPLVFSRSFSPAMAERGAQ